MKYKESQAPYVLPLIILLCCLCLYAPLSGLEELGMKEARYALMAMEMVNTGQWFYPDLFSQKVTTHPMFPWLLAIIGKISSLNEFSIRIAAYLPLFLLALICGITAKRISGNNAGAVAAVSVLASGVALQNGLIADEHTLFALFIGSAWLVWFYMGRVQKKWVICWSICHTLVFFALMTGGIKALFLFYFPLFWLRKPINIWRRLYQYDHLISLSIFMIIVILYVFLFPEFNYEFYHFRTSVQPGASNGFGGYLSHLAYFPFKMAIGYIPWVFFCWPTFCNAFRPLEHQPLLSSYLRTIITSLFFFFWIIPFGDPIIILSLIAPMAILIANNYDLLVRRYGHQLLYITKITAVVVIIAGMVAVSFAYISSQDIVNANFSLLSIFSIVSLVVISLLLSFYMLKTKIPLPCWLLILMSVISVKFMYSGSYQVYRYIVKSDNRMLAKTLTEKLPEDTVLYWIKKEKEQNHFDSEFYYMGHKVAVVTKETDLPNEQFIYVIGNENQPIVLNREWLQLSDKVSHKKDLTFCIWKGGVIEEVNHWGAASIPPETIKVSEWKEDGRGKIFRQKNQMAFPEYKNFGIKHSPSIYFEKSQYLAYNDSEFVQHFSEEFTVIIVFKPLDSASKQCIIDISNRHTDETVFLRLMYLPKTEELIFYSASKVKDKKGTPGQEVLYTMKTFSEKIKCSRDEGTIIAIRRDSKGLRIDHKGKNVIKSERWLSDINPGPYTISMGAQWKHDKGKYQQFFKGYISEFSLYSSAISDYRLNKEIGNLTKKYLFEQ
ncbi:MAG: hypothetical protein HRT89_00610 [Lentisphaeria bacterium]|nr:hypothetical protein [Lentisphaeria bacterium]